MKKTAFVIGSILILFLTAFTLNEGAILGNWKAPDLENSTIKVYKSSNGYFYGKIIDSDKKEWINEIILKKAKFDPKTKSWKGQIYSLARDITIDVTLSLESTQKLKLVGKKYFFTKTFYWSR